MVKSMRIVSTAPLHLIPTLKHNLDAVIHSNPSTFNPLKLKITQPSEFNYSKLAPFKPSGTDPSLQTHAATERASYYSSTSSFTPLLTKLYQAITNNRVIPFVPTKSLMRETRNLTKTVRNPTSFLLTRKGDAGYSIDYDKVPEDNNGFVLGKLGLSMEKQLCLDEEAYKGYLLPAVDGARDVEADNVYNYTMVRAPLLTMLVFKDIDKKSDRLCL
jgi:hypothetical protein